MLDNTCLKKDKKKEEQKKKNKKRKIIELRQSTKMPFQLTVFHSQTRYELWP